MHGRRIGKTASVADAGDRRRGLCDWRGSDASGSAVLAHSPDWRRCPAVCPSRCALSGLPSLRCGTIIGRRRVTVSSIYRGFRSVPEDVHAHSVAHKGDPACEPGNDAPPPDHLRRAQPVAVLLPRTASWLAEIPEKFRPTTLATQFPRIANLVRATWADPSARGKYLQELLAGSRPNRKGFPPSVLRELQRLHAVHLTLHDLNRSLWDGEARN